MRQVKDQVLPQLYKLTSTVALYCGATSTTGVAASSNGGGEGVTNKAKPAVVEPMSAVAFNSLLLAFGRLLKAGLCVGVCVCVWVNVCLDVCGCLCVGVCVWVYVCVNVDAGLFGCKCGCENMDMCV